jgi:hypothetical protein
MNRRLDARAGVGIALVALGVAALVAQFVPLPAFDFGRYVWPIFVILPGVTFLAVGLAVEGVSGFVIAGAVITVTGLVLAVQNTFDVWATWAYAWALIAPGAVGAGILLQGWVRHSRALRAIGRRLLWSGLGLFVVLGAFFEGVLHISGVDLGPVGKVLLPAVLILAGVGLLVRRAVGSARTGGAEIAASR